MVVETKKYCYLWKRILTMTQYGDKLLYAFHFICLPQLSRYSVLVPLHRMVGGIGSHFSGNFLAVAKISCLT